MDEFFFDVVFDIAAGQGLLDIVWGLSKRGGSNEVRVSGNRLNFHCL